MRNYSLEKVYLGNGYQLAAVKVYPKDGPSFTIENKGAKGKRLQNAAFMAFADNLVRQII